MKLTFACPCCERKLCGVPSMQHATMIVKRTCRCGARWQIKVTPLCAGGDYSIHAGDFLRLPG